MLKGNITKTEAGMLTDPRVKANLRHQSRDARLRQFVKFCLVGGSGVVVDMTVLHFLADSAWCGWNVSISKLCSAEAAMLNNFLWNEVWTFRDSTADGRPVPRRSTKAFALPCDLRRRDRISCVSPLPVLSPIAIQPVCGQLAGDPPGDAVEFLDERAF